VNANTNLKKKKRGQTGFAQVLVQFFGHKECTSKLEKSLQRNNGDETRALPKVKQFSSVCNILHLK
jgi:hypothetical protein